MIMMAVTAPCGKSGDKGNSTKASILLDPSLICGLLDQEGERADECLQFSVGGVYFDNHCPSLVLGLAQWKEKGQERLVLGQIQEQAQRSHIRKAPPATLPRIGY